MSRRPNAGGGKRNQPRSNVATRARFSTWRPPSKNLTKKFESSRDQKRAAMPPRHVSEVVAEVRQSSYGGQRYDDIERFELPKEILLRLARALEDAPLDPSSAPVVKATVGTVSNTSRAESSEGDTRTSVRRSKGTGAQKKPPTETSNSINDTLMSKFLGLGFTREEVDIVATTGLCHQDRFNHDEDAFIMNLIRVANNLDMYPYNSSVSREFGNKTIPDNENFLNEIEALGTIYDGTEVSEPVCLYGVPCRVLVVSLLDSEVPTIIKILIYNSIEYLIEGSSSQVYGWVISSSLSKERARQISLQGNQQLLSMGRALATGFEYVLYVQSRRDEVEDLPNNITKPIGCSDPKPIVSKPAKQVVKPKTTGNKPAGQNNPLGKRETASTETSPPNDQTGSFSGVKKPAVLPPIEMLTSLRLPEYTEALMLAINTELSGQAARDKARASLEYVLPSSTIAIIEKEEVILEMIRDRAFKLSTYGTRGEIACCKILQKETDLSKPKCKVWLQKAKESLEAADEAHARDETAMSIKWVEEALRLLNEKEKNVADKKKSKLEEKQSEQINTDDGKPLRIEAVISKAIANIDVTGDGQRRKEKGPTIRASYELAAQAQSTEFCDRTECTAATSSLQHTKGEIYTNEYSDFLGSAIGNSGGEVLEIVPCSLENDPEVNQQLIDELSSKRSLQKYKDILAKREQLPTYRMRDTVVTAIAQHRVAVISGDTGCGKTTQVPQLLLDDFIDRGEGSLCNIIVTQPRRISAISVAERIAQERTERIGQTAGYNIRLESKRSDNTRILLVTTGILMRRLLLDRSLSDITHIFVDEVHERDINTDFLLIVLKQLLDMRPDLKVILMSATLNASLFESYFKSYGSVAIHIPGRTFPVTSYFLEDALEHTGFTVEATCNPDILQRSSAGGKGKGKSSGRDSESSEAYCGALNEQEYLRRRMISINNMRSQQKYSQGVLTTLEMLNESAVNVELITALVLRIMSQDPHGAILIFVPGFSDIKNIIESLNNEPLSDKMNILPLHSSLSSQEQTKVFQVPKKGIWKVVVSTNIAETSITIEDVLYVIDTCRTKENRYDEINQMSVLEDTWASKANAGQRRGRAGRVRSGICYHLTSTFTYNCLLDYAIPEMLRLGLEELVLQILALDLGDPFRFLLSAVSPPTLISIRHALNYLDSIGAVTLGDGDTPVSNSTGGASEDQYVPSCISPLGYHLATLPVNARIGKLMLYGVLLRCVDPILTIAAFNSVKSPFVSSFDSREESDAARKTFLTADSDLLTMLKAYDSWAEIVASGHGSIRAAETFCSRNYLSSMSLRQIQQIRGQFIELLRDIGFISADVKISNVKTCESNMNGSNVAFVKCALCAGMSPNIAVAIGSGKKCPANLKGPGGAPITIAVKKKICESTFAISGNNTIYLHPSSVMSDVSIDTLKNSYFLFLDAVRTSKVYARDFNRVDISTLALFGGKLRSLHGGRLMELSGRVYLRVDPQLLQCVIFLRELMDRVFLEKVLDPQMKDCDNPHVQQMHECINIFMCAI